MKTKKIYIPIKRNLKGKIIKKVSYKDVDINTPTKIINGKRYLLKKEEIQQIEEKEKLYLKQKNKNKKNNLIKKRKDYLKLTDWYVIRSIEDIEIPKKIKEKRQTIRNEINEIEKITKKEDLLKFNNFEV